MMEDKEVITIFLTHKDWNITEVGIKSKSLPQGIKGLVDIVLMGFKCNSEQVSSSLILVRRFNQKNAQVIQGALYKEFKGIYKRRMRTSINTCKEEMFKGSLVKDTLGLVHIYE